MAQPGQELGGGNTQQGFRKCEIQAESGGGGASTGSRGGGKAGQGSECQDRGLSRERRGTTEVSDETQVRWEVSSQR